MLKSFFISLLAAAGLAIIFYGQARGGQFELLTLDPGMLTTDKGASSVGETRDPFSWPAEIVAKLHPAGGSLGKDMLSKFILQGIIWDEEEPLAIINNKILMTGDRIMDITLAMIEKDQVVLTYKDYRKELSLTRKYYELPDASQP